MADVSFPHFTYQHIQTNISSTLLAPICLQYSRQWIKPWTLMTTGINMRTFINSIQKRDQQCRLWGNFQAALHGTYSSHERYNMSLKCKEYIRNIYCYNHVYTTFCNMIHRTKYDHHKMMTISEYRYKRFLLY